MILKTEGISPTLDVFCIPRIRNQSTGNAYTSEMALHRASAVHLGDTNDSFKQLPVIVKFQ